MRLGTLGGGDEVGIPLGGDDAKDTGKWDEARDTKTLRIPGDGGGDDAGRGYEA